MKKFKPTFGIRGRILVIALIPSLALLSSGVAVTGYLVHHGLQVRDWAKQVTQATVPAIELTGALQQERRLTLAKIAGAPTNPSDLAAQRGRVNAGLQAAADAAGALRGLDPTTIDQIWAAFSPLTAELPAMRAKVDSNALSAQDAYAYFTQMITLVEVSLNVTITTAPDPVTTIQETAAVGLFDLEESASRSAALTPFAATKAGLSPAQLTEFTGQVGYYHREADNMKPAVQGQEQAQLLGLMASPAWKQVSAMEDAVIHRSIGSTADSGAPVNAVDWQNSANQVSDELMNLYRGHQDRTLRTVSDDGNRIARNSLLGGAAALALALVALGVALWLSSRLIGRLRRLRTETLTVADNQLPDVMRRVRAGETVDIEAAVAHLDYGSDEIGQVADAFNRAQHAAVSAAVTEAKTQDGVKALFLNIAHRSQIVIHKQLEILEKAEHDEHDSTRLAVLFDLDHLATRERRNAENLVILGGEQPGRRWRSPVALLDLVRSAVAETEDFARVHITKMPEKLITGAAVADLVHLLAELVDNATSFSPPESRVDVSGIVVGKGIAVEISDQGLGMEADEIERVNETLRNPPDFSVASLSSDSRLGLFVVATLAHRTGTSVRLTESDYGGIRVIVIVPTALIAACNGGHDEPAHEPEAKTLTSTVLMTSEPTAHTNGSAPSGALLTNGRHSVDGKPTLPRRSKQANLAPQLVVSETSSDEADTVDTRTHTAEHTRDLFAAIEDGTRQARSELTGGDE